MYTFCKFRLKMAHNLKLKYKHNTRYEGHNTCYLSVYPLTRVNIAARGFKLNLPYFKANYRLLVLTI